MKIKKGDNVIVISGKDRGKKGKVLNVHAEEKRIVVEGVSLRKKHIRPRKMGQKGEVITLPGTIHSSNVLVWCQKCGKGVRVGYKIVAEKKTRVCKKCSNEI